jgi:hypothetical protein
VLALATVGALLIAEHLKSEKALTTSAIWQPSAGVFDPQVSSASFSFTSPYADRVGVSVVSSATGRIVAVIARDYPLTRYHRTAQFQWSGRTSTGALEPNGRYVVQVHFDRRDRTTQVPQINFELSR